MPVFSAAVQPAILLKIRSEIGGDTDFLVGKNGYSMLNRKNKSVLYMHAPDWNVYYANLQNKVYCQCKPEDWRAGPGVLSALLRPSSPTSLRLTTSKPAKLKGLACLEFKMETKEASRGNDRTWKQLLPKEGTIWLYPQDGFPRQAFLVAAGMLALPNGPGFPLAMKFTRYDNLQCEEVRLYGFEKKMAEEAEFAPPKGFKQVKDQAAVMNKGVESKDFADFLQEK